MSLFTHAVITFLISMVPVLELRGSLLYAYAGGLPPLAAAAIAIVGNFVPIPFIILFARRVFAWMNRKSPRLAALAEKIETRATKKSDALRRGVVLGLMIFVAIPLPGTGAWTGALIAAVLNIRMKTALPAIALGVIIAGALVTGIVYGLFGAILG